MITAGKLCVISNIAPHYRKGIYNLLEKNADCKWIFGSNGTNIPSLNIGNYNDAYVLQPKRGKGNTLWLRGATKLALDDEKVSDVLMLGDVKFLTSWSILLKNKLLPRKKHKKIHLWTHGFTGTHSPLLSKGIVRKLKLAVYKLYLNLADSVFFYGKTSAEIAGRMGIDKEKIEIVHNSLDHDKTTAIRKALEKSDIYSRLFNNAYPTVLFIGRITAIKRVDLAIRALKEIQGRGISVNLAIVGDGDESEELKKLAESLHVNDRIAWIGECYDEVVTARYIHEADLCVSPGNVGLTAIHSLSYGTPVVTNDDFLTQMPEYEAISEEKGTGAFFRKGDYKDLADKICMLLNADDKERVREVCRTEIDKNWTPSFQLEIFKKRIGAIK